MKQHHLLSLLQNDFTTIHVAFRSDIDNAVSAPSNGGTSGFETTRSPKPKVPRTYTYKALITDELKADDFVVVDHPKGGPMVGLVISVDAVANIDVDADFEYKWIVQKINRVPYETRLKKESEFLETMKAVEREAQRSELVKKFAEHLPEGSPARQLYDTAVSNVVGDVKSLG